MVGLLFSFIDGSINSFEVSAGMANCFAILLAVLKACRLSLHGPFLRDGGVETASGIKRMHMRLHVCQPLPLHSLRPRAIVALPNSTVSFRSVAI